MKCVILQPSYIPWRGYFHQIQKADLFVFYDDVQYDKHGWRNRNRIKTAAGTQWMTVPVLHRGVVSAGTPIHEVEICWDLDWSAKHLGTLRHAYARAPHLERYLEPVAEIFAQRPRRLVDLTIPLTVRLAAEAGITGTEFTRSSELGVAGHKTDRLIRILRQVGANHYISGPSARAYLDVDQMREAGITVEFMTYDYPTYVQLHPPYDPSVTILDLLFMAGEQTPDYIWKHP